MKGVSLLTELGVVNIPELDIRINIEQQKFLLKKHISYTTEPFFLKSKISEKSKDPLNSEGNFYYFNNMLSGLVKLNNKLSQPVLNLEAHNLSVEGYHSFLQVEAHVLNLKQQVQWTLEDGAETPEGQEHIWQLYDELNNKRNSITQIMTQKVFSDSDSRLKLTLELPQTNTFLPNFLSLALKQKLSLFSEHGVLNQVNSHYQVEIKSNNNKLLINDNSMTWEKLLRNIQLRGTKLKN